MKTHQLTLNASVARFGYGGITSAIAHDFNFLFKPQMMTRGRGERGAR